VKKKEKKLLILLTSFAILVSLVSANGRTVFAEEPETDNNAEVIQEKAEAETEVTEQKEETETGEQTQEDEVFLENDLTVSKQADETDAENLQSESNNETYDLNDETQDDSDEDPEETKEKIIVTYDYNYDGKGTYKTEEYTLGEDGTVVVTVIDDILSREGVIFDWVFSGWSEDRNAGPNSSSKVLPGATFEASDNVTLYVIWGENKWGDTLHASGNGTEFTYDGNYHQIKGINERPENDRTCVKGYNYSSNYYYQPLWYSLNVWRYTYFGNIQAGGTDVGSYSTPATGQVYAEIWVPWPWDNEWVRVEDTFTQIIPATMKINPASLTVKADDQRKKYTGSEITPDGSLEGLVTPEGKDKETATLNLSSFKEVGEHSIKYSITWDGTAKQKNYTISEDLGALTIYYELNLDANGVEGAPEMMEVESDSVILPDVKPTKKGKTFVGWATSANAKKAQYKAGQTITLNDNTTLYAVYRSNVIPPIPMTGVDKGPGSAASAVNNGTACGTILFVAGLAIAVVMIRKKKTA